MTGREKNKNCYHYKRGNCAILTDENGKLNCELHKCSFYETKEEYTIRQDEFNKKQYKLYKERV